MTGIGRTNVETARDEGLAESIADVTGLSTSAIQERIDEAHGRTLLRNLFDVAWPTEGSDFEGQTSAWARDHELFEELTAVTGLSERTVQKKLGEAHGKTHVQNVFENHWPDSDADGAENEAQLERATSASPEAAAPAKKSAGEKTKRASMKAAERTGSLGFESKLWEVPLRSTSLILTEFEWLTQATP